MTEVHIRMNEFSKAERSAEDMVGILQELGAVEDEAAARMHVLGRVYLKQDKNNDALDQYASALELARRADEKNLEALALMLLSSVRSAVGDYEQAVTDVLLSVDLYHNEGDKQGEGRALKMLADIQLAGNNFPDAMRVLSQAE